jgi:hypothetical protein
MRLTKVEKEHLYPLVQNQIQELKDIDLHEGLDDDNKKQLKALENVQRKLEIDLYE